MKTHGLTIKHDQVKRVTKHFFSKEEEAERNRLEHVRLPEFKFACQKLKSAHTIFMSFINNISSLLLPPLNNYNRTSRYIFLGFPSSKENKPSFREDKRRNAHSHFDPSSSLGITSLSSWYTSTSDMGTVEGQGVYPLQRCKTIHWVRHAQGFHNVALDKDRSEAKSPAHFDAHLTPLGWEQVDRLRKHVHSLGLSSKIELVVVSPLMRTLQTAVGVFGGESYLDGIDSPALMVEYSDRPAISSLNCPRFVAVELCREHLGVYWYDKRRNISEYKPIFPAIDFSLIESDADNLWKVDIREKNEEIVARGLDFMKWLWTRKEKEIAVVTHYGFLAHTLRSFGDDCHPSIKTEICKPFSNCELRSMMVVDKSMVQVTADVTSNTDTNFPGKIPRGPDAPSDDDAVPAATDEEKAV